jgi:hypothetical protein
MILDPPRSVVSKDQRMVTFGIKRHPFRLGQFENATFGIKRRIYQSDVFMQIHF